MRKSVIKFIFVFTLSLFFVLPVFAFDLDSSQTFRGRATQYGYDATDAYSLSDNIGKVINIALTLVGTLFLAFTVYAGFLWLTARGNEEEVKKAIGIIKTSVIGIIIATSAYAITSFVLPKILEKTTGEGGGGGMTSSIADKVGCCNKCSDALSPDDPGCTTSVVGDQTECQNKCPLGSVFKCYYSLKKAEECK